MWSTSEARRPLSTLVEIKCGATTAYGPPLKFQGGLPFHYFFRRGPYTVVELHVISTRVGRPQRTDLFWNSFYYDFSRGPYALIDPHLIFTWAESGLLASLVARKYVFHYFCPTLYTNLGHKVANFECHDIPLFCPSGPPIFCPTATSAEITQSEQKRWSCGNSIFHKRRPLFGLLNILGFLFLCTHCSLRVLSKGQSTSWLCIKVSHANGIYWTLRVH